MDGDLVATKVPCVISQGTVNHHYNNLALWIKIVTCLMVFHSLKMQNTAKGYGWGPGPGTQISGPGAKCFPAAFPLITFLPLPKASNIN